MFVYYLQERSYYFASDDKVLSHIQELSKIVSKADKYDHFLISHLFDATKYNRNTTIGDYLASNKLPNAIRIRVWPTIKKRCKIIKNNFLSLADLAVVNPQTSNAFLGPDFSHKSIALIVNCNQYQHFRYVKACETVCGVNFGNCCDICLNHVKVTSDAVNMVKPLGTKVPVVFKQLIELNEYIDKFWEKGPFNEGDVMAKTTLTISDESNTVKQNPHYKKLRYFNIPGLGSQYCYKHIKQGSLRMHYYEDNTNRIIYIPYIGPHLRTKKF